MKKAIGLSIAGMFLIAGTVSGDILMDQIGPNGDANLGAYASQDFEAAYDIYDCIAYDDFTINSAMTLDSFSAVFGGWGAWAGQFDAVTAWTINIYSSSAAAGSNLTGDVASIVVGQGGWSAINVGWMGGDQLSAKLDFDVSGVELDAGTYWIGINGSLVFADNGQIGAARTDETIYNGSPMGENAWQANPGDGFGNGSHWLIDVDGAGAGANLAYELTGNEVPAPGVLALLGLAGFVARRRRR